MAGDSYALFEAIMEGISKGEVPRHLFHGTDSRALASILETGGITPGTLGEQVFLSPHPGAAAGYAVHAARAATPGTELLRKADPSGKLQGHPLVLRTKLAKLLPFLDDKSLRNLNWARRRNLAYPEALGEAAFNMEVRSDVPVKTQWLKGAGLLGQESGRSGLAPLQAGSSGYYAEHGARQLGKIQGLPRLMKMLKSLKGPAGLGVLLLGASLAAGRLGSEDSA